MKCRLIFPAALTGLLFFTALSTGNAVVLTVALVIAVIIVFSLLSVVLTARGITCDVRLPERTVCRGGDVRVQVTVESRCPMPTAPVQAEMRIVPDEPPVVLTLTRGRGRRQTSSAVIHAGHVGVTRPGVSSYVISDLFGMFVYRVTPAQDGPELIVLPQTFEIADLSYAPGDSGMETLARATEDLSDPSDTRTYQPGDPMKKIHWKLSLRKRELMVRRFEEAALPDALVLMDCARPRASSPAEEADLRDALLETAASLMVYAGEGHTVRLPLMGSHPVQLVSSMGTELVMEELARCDFSGTDRFERVLMLESRRMSRVGCCVIVTAWLNGALVEAVTAIRRMGPYVRVYLVTSDPESERNLKYVSRLQQRSCEVAYVMPAEA